MLRSRMGLEGIPRPAWLLLGGNLLNATGLGLFWALLALYVVARGGSPGLVGVIGAAALTGAVAAQAPGGWIADRFDRRRIVILTMAGYGLFFLVYLLPMPVVYLVGVRFAHAVLAGLYMPAARALLADYTAAANRPAAFGHWQASMMGGFVIGPVLGGFLAVFDYRLVFLGAAAVSLAGAALLLTIPGAGAKAQADHAPEADKVRESGWLSIATRIWPATAASAAWYFMGGIYGATWSLLVVYWWHGTTVWLGLTLAFYSVPVVLFSGAAGSLGDRFGLRRVVAVTLVAGAAFALAYAFTGNLYVVVALGLVEAICTLAGSPALAAEVSRAVSAREQGRAQGMFSLASTAIEAAGSLAGGLLFAIWPPLIFGAVAAGALLALVAVPFIGRRAVGGAPEGLPSAPAIAPL